MAWSGQTLDPEMIYAVKDFFGNIIYRNLLDSAVVQASINASETGQSCSTRDDLSVGDDDSIPPQAARGGLEGGAEPGFLKGQANAVYEKDGARFADLVVYSRPGSAVDVHFTPLHCTGVACRLGEALLAAACAWSGATTSPSARAMHCAACQQQNTQALLVQYWEGFSGQVYNTDTLECNDCSEGFIKFSNGTEDCVECASITDGLHCLGANKYELLPGYYMSVGAAKCDLEDTTCVLRHVHKCEKYEHSCKPEHDRFNQGDDVIIALELLCREVCWTLQPSLADTPPPPLLTAPRPSV
ncbi:hypothetical protein CYMTET_31674 [Cymbomonas tetramitiformis]|uniref:Uncharacterized protein n=1 Tax=Cymbomonas tetramitiformis TaxID=36881 RepID=A0AAE0KSN4_9CHLO|nr:hypothetical protein CYMTET_31674 [Cymbomonas tetramitiformis]